MDGQTVRDWLAAVNDGVPANAVVRRPASRSGWCARVMVVASNCSGPFVKTSIPQDRRPTAVGVVREDGSTTMSVDGRGWSLPVSTLCTVLNSSTDKFVLVSLHLGSPRKPSAKPRFLISSSFHQFGAFIGGRVKRNR